MTRVSKLKPGDPGSDAAKARGCPCFGTVWGRTKATRQTLFAVYDDCPLVMWHLWVLGHLVGDEEGWEGV